MDRRFNVLIACVAAALCGHAAAANRCTDAKGRVTYQDAACSMDADTNAKVDTSEAFSTRPAPSTAPRASVQAAPSASARSGTPGEYATYRGAWRGPLQFELSINGVREGDAHAIAPVVLELRS